MSPFRVPKGLEVFFQQWFTVAPWDFDVVSSVDRVYLTWLTWNVETNLNSVALTVQSTFHLAGRSHGSVTNLLSTRQRRFPKNPFDEHSKQSILISALIALFDPIWRPGDLSNSMANISLNGSPKQFNEQTKIWLFKTNKSLQSVANQQVGLFSHFDVPFFTSKNRVAVHYTLLFHKFLVSSGDKSFRTLTAVKVWAITIRNKQTKIKDRPHWPSSIQRRSDYRPWHRLDRNLLKLTNPISLTPCRWTDEIIPA